MVSYEIGADPDSTTVLIRDRSMTKTRRLFSYGTAAGPDSPTVLILDRRRT